MRIRPIFLWSLRAAVAVAAVAFAATWQGDLPASPGVVYSATWEGNWDASTGHWVGTIKYSFDDTGDKAWTDAEKTVVREATKEWEDLPDSNVDFDEVATGGDVTLRWAKDNDRDGTTLESDDAGIMTGAAGDSPPTGVDFHTDPSAGWYVDPDPTTDEAIPDGGWDFLSVAKHELGHVLGLKHTFGTVASMDTWSTGDRQHLTDSDQEATANLYPAPEAAPAPTPTPEPASEVGEAILFLTDPAGDTDCPEADVLSATVEEVEGGLEVKVVTEQPPTWSLAEAFSYAQVVNFADQSSRVQTHAGVGEQGLTDINGNLIPGSEPHVTVTDDGVTTFFAGSFDKGDPLLVTTFYLANEGDDLCGDDLMGVYTCFGKCDD